MSEPAERTADATDGTGAGRAVAVTVVRSGGFAGISRRWAVQAGVEDAPHWIALLEDCPWDDPGQCADAREGGADRFAWSVHAILPGAGGEVRPQRPAERRAELTESQASGPWRTLIDAVRAAAAPGRAGSAATEQ